MRGPALSISACSTFVFGTTPRALMSSVNDVSMSMCAAWRWAVKVAVPCWR